MRTETLPCDTVEPGGGPEFRVAKPGWRSYAQFFRESAYTIFPQQHRSLGGRLSFNMIEVEQSDHDFTDPDVPETVLALPLAASAHNSWSWNMGNGWRHATAAPGHLLVLPPGIESRWRVVGQRRLLLLTLPTDTLENVLGCALPADLAHAFDALAQHPWEDTFVAQTMLRLWAASLESKANDRLLADGALIAMIAHLLQRAGAGDLPERRVAMPTWRLQRVTEFADAHLHEDLCIASLADVAGLSVRHFARAFNLQVGETPHRWLMYRRIEKAKQRLAHSDDSLARIAQDCGFTAQSHFTRVFRLITGETPKQWQKSHKQR